MILMGLFMPNIDCIAKELYRYLRQRLTTKLENDY